MPRVFSTSKGSNWSLPLVNAGIASSALLNMIPSWIVKPRSARTKSPGSNLSRILQCSVGYLSDVLPPQALEIKEILP